MVRRMFTSSALVAALLTLAICQQPAAAQNVTQPLVRITDIEIVSVVLDEVEGLIANAVVTLDVLGREVTENVPIPLTLGGSEGGECEILNLAVGPLNLDLLGLVVDLDDCEGGPVTVDILAGGGLLGDLLCDVAGGLLGGIDLGDILTGLPDGAEDVLTGAIRDVLNGILGELLAPGLTAAAHQGGGGGGGSGQHRCDILSLTLPEGLTLDVDLVGLTVLTSGICLDVYAERGDGNLLGNLLCNLSGLLDRPANNNALQSHVRNILRLLDRLGL